VVAQAGKRLMSSAAEKRHLARVHSVPCVLCMYLGFGPTPSTAHHIRDGQGGAQKAPDFLTAALCQEHHQGDTGIHGLGTRAFEARYKLSELDLVAMTLEAVYG